MTRWLALAVCVLGCGPPTPTRLVPPIAPVPRPPTATATPTPTVAPKPLDQDLPRLVERDIELYQDVARILVTPGIDCADATAQLADLQPRYAEVVAANVKVVRDGRAKALQTALEPHQPELDAAATSIAQSEALARCARDRAFTAAVDRLVEP